MTSSKEVLAVAMLLLLPVANAGTLPMYDAAYKAGKSRIVAEHKSAVAACAAKAGRIKDDCMQRAAAADRAARAQLKHSTAEASVKPDTLVAKRAEAAN